jgi:hypothetical protein
MGAKHVINPNQLTMFERAGDLASPDVTHHGDISEFEHFDDFSARKLSESFQEPADDGTERPLYTSIQEEGIHQPVLLEHSEDRYGSPLHSGMPTKVLADGHHRVFSQASIDPSAWVPVKWIP